MVARPAGPRRARRTLADASARPGRSTRGEPEALREFGVDAASTLLRGGPRFDDLRRHLLQPLQRRGRPASTRSCSSASARTSWSPRTSEATDALEDGLIDGRPPTGVPAVGGRAQRHRSARRSRSSPSCDLSTVDSVDLASGQGRAGLRAARGRAATSGSRRPPTACSRPARPRRGAARLSAPLEWLAASPSRSRSRCCSPAAGSRDMLERRAARARTTPGASVAFPAGRRARRLLAGARWRRWRRSTTAPTSTCSTPSCAAGSPTSLGVALLGLLDDALGRGAAERHAPRLARPRARRARRRLLDRRDQGGRRARARRLRGLRARAARRSTTSATWRCCCWRRTSSTCSTCGPGGSRRRSWRCSPASASAHWTLGAARAARALHRPGAGRGAAFTLRERAMLGDTGSNLVGALAGISLLRRSRTQDGR